MVSTQKIWFYQQSISMYNVLLEHPPLPENYTFVNSLLNQDIEHCHGSTEQGVHKFWLGMDVVPWERSFIHENKRNYRKRSHHYEKKNEHIERVLKNIWMIIKRTNGNCLTRMLKSWTRSYYQEHWRQYWLKLF